ncbi:MULTISPECIES: zinc-dependent metalloprotease [Micrococcus]|uniref:zinc-dependent metalloprotease n=1 Tax=Micrococcus TaxID=1269 RepID=UPI001E29E57D|nr:MULTISPECIES: zinc-dependent metalloprotease [Micrococcus]MCD0179057.1 zinc-dependent metalloprotease [Micrococcus luteus]WHM16553.1 zinc-dependent metalloprotease [Micrococcus yunnanensis]
MSDDHATDRPRAAADAEPGAPAEPGPAVAHPVDWAFAARTARSLAAAGPRFTPREATREAEGLRAAAEAAVPHVHRLTGLEAARDLRDSQVLVVDRPTWSRAATQSFATLLDPTFAHLRDTRPREHAAATTRVTRHATALEMGGILAWMSGRILGQYDPFIALPGPGGTAGGPAGGRLLLVAPNVAQVRAEINVDPADFRLWVCLHEQTHRVQFAAAPWLREHLRAEITALTVGLFDKAESLPERLRTALAAANPLGRDGADARPTSGLLGAIQDEEDRERLSRLTAVMSLLEGHANVVMDGVDSSVVSSVKTIRRRFDERGDRRSPLDRMLRRLLGMDAKMAQYRDGQRFVAAAVAELGMAGFNVVWDAPELLPSEAELHAPETWVARIRAQA